ncbi:gliding motility-associated C-terminal domain-containing protein, partial [Flavobacterium oreochromis]
ANTPSGTYSVTYQLCESDPVTGNNLVPTNCDTATATVVVNNPIVAKSDNDQIPAGTTGHVIITANDTLNGKPIVVGPGLGEVTLTVGTLPVGIKYDPNSGTVSVASTVADGTYTFDYTICENGAVPNNCQTTTVTIVVVAKVEANDDRYTVSNGSTGGVAGNVLTNDIVNNINQATTTNVVLGLVQGAKPLITVPVNSPVPVLDLTTGNVIVPPGTPSGQYTIEYEECLVINGIKVNVCDKATVTIQVEPEKGDEIVIYNHMTPNGDGYNDIFLIDGIDKFPNNTVE